MKFREFRAWHALLFPLFGIPAPDWTEKLPDQMEFELLDATKEDDEEELDVEGATTTSAPTAGIAFVDARRPRSSRAQWPHDLVDEGVNTFAELDTLARG